MIKKRLGDILEFQRGYDLPSHKRKNGKYPIFSSSGISGYHDNWKLDGENVITGRYGTIGEIYYYNGKCWALNTTLFVKNFMNNSAKYLYYLLRCVLKKEYGADKSTVPGVNRNDLHELIVPFCEGRNQQNSLISLLQKIDRKISLNNAINAELEKAAKLLYDYWFVQIDFPNAEGKPYRADGGKMVYNEQLKRKIPKGWKVDKLSKTSICSIMSLGIETFEGEKIYLSTSDVDDNEIVNHSVTTNYANRPQRANMQPRLYSVWFAKMKDTVKNILVNEGAEILVSDYIFSTGFFGLQCTATTLYYVWNYLRGDYFEKKKNLLATGATQQAINEDDIKSFDIIVPTELLLEQFGKIVAPYYHMMSKLQFENKELAALRDFLLPLLMNGKLRLW